MSTRVVDRVDEWDERPFTDGYRSLHEFADEEFSGLVRAGGAELFMTKGSVVGIRHGSIEDFEETGTAYESPSPALPLLAIMQETNDEVRAEYYSEKTSISEVDSTLADGGFTGYIELSDNVLSGDYYMVYHAGRSMSVGFVGASSRLIDGDEAFDTANDEVGIYQVRPADIEVIEIPDVETGSGSAAVADIGEDADEPAEDEEPDESAADEKPGGDDQDDEDTGSETDAADEPSDDGASTTGTESGTTTVDPDRETDERDTTTETTDASEETDEEVTSTGSTRDGTTDDSTSRTERSTADTQQQPETADTADGSSGEGAVTKQQPTGAKQGNTQSERSASSVGETGRQSAGTVRADSQHEQRQPTGGQAQSDQSRTQPQRPQGSEQSTQSTGTSDPDLALETRAIPSLDPERTSDPDESGGSARADTFSRTPEQHSQSQKQHSGTRQQTATQADTTQGSADAQSTQQTAQSQSAEMANGTTTQESTAQTTEQSASDEASPSAEVVEQVEELQAEVEERDEEISRLEAELDRKTTEYEDAKSQLEMLREERDELAAQVDRLESELDQLETQFGAATDAERRMTASEALAGTDIFPRYESKGDATLKKAHGGSHRREDVLGNLRLEKNTQFDSEAVSVSGQTYDEFLESTLEYRFVEWVVGNLLFEIRETGHEKALKDLYDAVPVIDWADLNGTVEVVYTEDGQETRSQESFDIVLRNRMGEPLIVANLNDSREGATESMMENLIRSAERVGQSSDAFAGAFLVTRSFFEPPALETADDATQGGLLSRDKRKSFVNLSRKRGYHLCLVEARNENFTLLVPEL